MPLTPNQERLLNLLKTPERESGEERASRIGAIKELLETMSPDELATCRDVDDKILESVQFSTPPLAVAMVNSLQMVNYLKSEEVIQLLGILKGRCPQSLMAQTEEGFNFMHILAMNQKTPVISKLISDLKIQHEIFETRDSGGNRPLALLRQSELSALREVYTASYGKDLDSVVHERRERDREMFNAAARHIDEEIVGRQGEPFEREITRIANTRDLDGYPILTPEGLQELMTVTPPIPDSPTHGFRAYDLPYEISERIRGQIGGLDHASRNEQDGTVREERSLAEPVPRLEERIENNISALDPRLELAVEVCRSSQRDFNFDVFRRLVDTMDRDVLNARNGDGESLLDIVIVNGWVRGVEYMVSLPNIILPVRDHRGEEIPLYISSNPAINQILQNAVERRQSQHAPEAPQGQQNRSGDVSPRGRRDGGLVL